MYATGLSIKPMRSRHQPGFSDLRRWVLVAGLIGVASLSLARVALGGTATVDRTVVVQPGDTLWSIAAAHYPGADPRERVDAIERLNGLSGPVIIPGATLELPQP